MSDEKAQPSKREVMLKNVRFFASCQENPTYRENYFRSCEAHGGEMLEVVATVRAEYGQIKI